MCRCRSSKRLSHSKTDLMINFSVHCMVLGASLDGEWGEVLSIDGYIETPLDERIGHRNCNTCRDHKSRRLSMHRSIAFRGYN